MKNNYIKHLKEIRNRKKCQSCLFPEDEIKIERILADRTKTCRPCKHLIKKICIDCGKEHGHCEVIDSPVSDFDFKHRCGYYND